MVVIRLARSGAKKRPFYHIVAADKRKPRDGRNIEQVGYYNPVARGAETGLYINLERVKYWQSVGAKPSDRVSSLLKKYQQQLITKEQEPETAAQVSVETAGAEKPKQEAAQTEHAHVKSQEGTDNTDTQHQEETTETEEKS